MINERIRPPFTASQWQELEHQALIFKYMVSGVPVPPDLISTVTRNLEYSSMSSGLLSQQPSLDWGCFQMGLGRTAEAEAEAGRCRRTDGKKWRCLKEAYPGSKYCERHMHRGRYRSIRKNVGLIPSANPPPSVSSISIYPNINSNSTPAPSCYLSSLASSNASEAVPHHHSTHLHHSRYPSPFSSRSPASSLSLHDYTAHHMFLDSASYPRVDKDYRYHHGVRDEVDERCLFSEGAGTTGSLSNSKSSSNGHSQLLFHSLNDNSKHEKQEQEEVEQHCFVLGTDFKSAKPIKSHIEEETQKPFHHFLGEWPLKTRNFWPEIDHENQSNHSLSLQPSSQFSHRCQHKNSVHKNREHVDA